MTTYAYNGDGSLVASTHSTTPPIQCGGLSTAYTVDLAASPDQIIASTISLGPTGQGCPAPITSDYLRDSAGTLLASASNATTTWYGLDRQGSVRQVLDENANLLAIQNYDPYGQRETTGQIGIFGYSGELQDATTSAEYLRARWYGPGTGTLLGVDPLVDATEQAYAYAGDDPVNGSDPSGTCWTISTDHTLMLVYNHLGGKGRCQPPATDQIFGAGQRSNHSYIIPAPGAFDALEGLDASAAIAEAVSIVAKADVASGAIPVVEGEAGADLTLGEAAEAGTSLAETEAEACGATALGGSELGPGGCRAGGPGGRRRLRRLDTRNVSLWSHAV
jgi:RHS repeat-associated protein